MDGAGVPPWIRRRLIPLFRVEFPLKRKAEVELWGTCAGTAHLLSEYASYCEHLYGVSSVWGLMRMLTLRPCTHTRRHVRLRAHLCVLKLSRTPPAVDRQAACPGGAALFKLRDRLDMRSRIWVTREIKSVLRTEHGAFTGCSGHNGLKGPTVRQIDEAEARGFIRMEHSKTRSSVLMGPCGCSHTFRDPARCQGGTGFSYTRVQRTCVQSRDSGLGRPATEARPRLWVCPPVPHHASSCSLATRATAGLSGMAQKIDCRSGHGGRNSGVLEITPHPAFASVLAGVLRRTRASSLPHQRRRAT